jgi:hypothetical protein
MISAYDLIIHSGSYADHITGNVQQPILIIIGNLLRYLCRKLKNIDRFNEKVYVLIPHLKRAGFTDMMIKFHPKSRLQVRGNSMEW